jgi:hypothetical protein
MRSAISVRRLPPWFRSKPDANLAPDVLSAIQNLKGFTVQLPGGP